MDSTAPNYAMMLSLRPGVAYLVSPNTCRGLRTSDRLAWSPEPSSASGAEGYKTRSESVGQQTRLSTGIGRLILFRVVQTGNQDDADFVHLQQSDCSAK